MWALFHLAVDPDNEADIVAAGALPPLRKLLESRVPLLTTCAKEALKRLEEGRYDAPALKKRRLD